MSNRSYTQGERRLVMRTNVAVCANGHVVSADLPFRMEEAWHLRHKHCGKWTWEDANYCVNCGGKLNSMRDKGNC